MMCLCILYVIDISEDQLTCLHSSDYRQIDPRYGTLDDWDQLVASVHERNMKLMYVLPFELS